MNKILLAIAVTLSLSGCVFKVGNRIGHDGQDVSVTFGNVDVADGEYAGRLEATNGNITIGNTAKVATVAVTNGNIELGNDDRAKSLTTTNGNIEAGTGAVIELNVATVNGNIKFGAGARIGGNIEITTGSIKLGQGSKVEGDIVFAESGGWLSSLDHHQPKLELGEGVIVIGQIHLYQAVTLTLPASVDPQKVIHHYAKK